MLDHVTMGLVNDFLQSLIICPLEMCSKDACSGGEDSLGLRYFFSDSPFLRVPDSSFGRFPEAVCSQAETHSEIYTGRAGARAYALALQPFRIVKIRIHRLPYKVGHEKSNGLSRMGMAEGQAI
jgi:hypothetical protein